MFDIFETTNSAHIFFDNLIRESSTCSQRLLLDIHFYCGSLDFLAGRLHFPGLLRLALKPTLWICTASAGMSLRPDQLILILNDFSMVSVAMHSNRWRIHPYRKIPAASQTTSVSSGCPMKRRRRHIQSHDYGGMRPQTVSSVTAHYGGILTVGGFSGCVQSPD